MISYDKQCIFIHIPRTGGTTIENMIWPKINKRTEAELWMGFVDSNGNKYQTGGLQHLLGTQIKDNILDKILFDDFFKFTIVRNPWDKAISQFIFMNKRNDLREYLGMNSDCSFLEYLSLIQTKKHVQWESQYKFIFDDNGALLVDYIGRFERFKCDVTKILGALDIRDDFFGLHKRNIPHTNQSVRSHYSEYYDEETKGIVADIYKEDIKIFCYEYSR